MPENDSQVAIPSKSFMEAINQSNAHMLRSITFFMLIFIFLLIALVLFFKSITANGEFKAEFNNDGRLVFEVKKTNIFSQDKKTSFVSFLLPSNVIWFDTGLELDPDETCSFKITGSVHLALHSIVRSAEKDEKNPIPWTDAKGNKWVNIGDKEEGLNAKKQLLIKQGETIGNVLGFYVPVEETNDFKQYFAQNRKSLSSKIYEINNEKSIVNDTKKRVRIYLTVNDILLNFDSSSTNLSKIAYEGKNRKWGSNWEIINKIKYDNLYFDDNIGNYLVQVEIKGK